MHGGTRAALRGHRVCVRLRDGERKRAAAARRRFGPDPPAMALDDPPAGGEADAAALVTAAAAGEHLEDRAVGRQADAVVADGEGPAACVAACRDRNHRLVAVVELQT